MPKKILGIDPGTAILGWSYLEADGGDPIKSSVEYGAITTKAGLDMSDRLVIIHDEFEAILKKYKPEYVGIEEVFFSKNVKTAITVAQARGVVVMMARKAGAKVMHFKPNEIKESVTGYGGADKSQMQNMVKMILGLDEIPKPDDAADAVGVAICTAQMAQFEERVKF